MTMFFTMLKEGSLLSVKVMVPLPDSAAMDQPKKQGKKLNSIL